MPFAPARLVLDAVLALEGANPLAVVTLPALLRNGASTGADVTSVTVPFGSGAETALLDEFFLLPRPPDQERPWRAPWSARTPWQKRKYPGGVLQRLRTDASGRGQVFIHRKAASRGDQDQWGLTATPGAELMTGHTYTPVRIVDLALWFGREIDTAAIDPAALVGLPPDAPDLDRLVAWFNATFAPDVGDLVGTVYLDDVPADYRGVPFADAPIDEETAQQLGSLPPAPTVSLDLGAVVTRLEDRLRRDRYELPEGLVRRVLTAWLRGDMVVLVGQPGTGKSLFANLLGRAMEAEFDLDAPLLISVRADFDEAEFVGYERLDGTPQLREFATQILLSDTPLEARVVVLEEFNLASIETYMASILVAAQERDRLVRLPNGDRAHLPIDTFFLATCNSFRDEPETRTRVSSPTKRRATTITMPNVLGDRFDDDPDTAVSGVLASLVESERSRVSQRLDGGRAAQFDSLRNTALESVASLSDLSDEVRDALAEVTAAILSTTPGRSWFTLGLLRDVVMSIVMADRDPASELAALGESVADKLVHQLRGAHTDVQELLAATAGLPNAAEISRLIEHAKQGPEDELLPLL